MFTFEATSRADVIANYDAFGIDEDLTADWVRMVADLDASFYKTATRYSGSAFMRLKLGQVFPDERSHIFESKDQARAFLDR